jgi:hypothetical protein
MKPLRRVRGPRSGVHFLDPAFAHRSVGA